ncbi:MAG: ISKra4 family transposase, partial [Actinobacteria bacterium]|nr:ISKra4 family transposase [Actinomycetota bacterium]
RKRMAEVGAVYDVTPVARSPADVMAPHDDAQPVPAPVATGKWLCASVVDDAAEVVGKLFDEAQRRDPDHLRTWVALVDGNNHQIETIRSQARERGIDGTIVIDFVHVLEYLWRAAWSFFDEGDLAAETWVADKACAVLEGDARQLAAGIRRRATRQGLDPPRRVNADRCATYLTNKAGYLDYPTALASGWPIATGVIEGACRHLVKDRMDLTGARWGLDGAEAILKLRTLRSNGDFDDYWSFHLVRERQRVHQSRYADNVIPQAA